MIDIIFVADTKKPMHRSMTQAAINSCRASENRMQMNFIVVDSNQETRGFNNAKTITYDFEFNYNKCLNLGIKYTKYDTIALCNNDLLFRKGWARKILRAMNEGNYLSACPYDRNTKLWGCREGYKVEKEVKGWCIVIKRELLDIIGPLATPVSFWFSDNVYADQLKKHNIKHILCYDSMVSHLRSKTLLSKGGRRGLTTGQGQKYKEWKTAYLKT
ncbi:unnamed protein product [marine sediment metagenome]|uniref:Glycosyltransferase 2-like domain-containing protein n=1 Tax=marine sediment metagenome TaxID=412755 RepID=X0ZC86_9ZZZZ